MGLCGSNEEANPMPDTIINWAQLFSQIEKRIKAKPLPASPFYLVVLMETSEFKWSELTDPESKEAAYNLLEQTLVDFHKAKLQQEEKEREEKKKAKQRKSQVYGDRDKIPESEMDEMLKQKQASRLLKIVVRFLQRKLIMWNKELQKGPITSNALKNREIYACVDGEPAVADDDDSDKEDEDKDADNPTKGWVPSPKEDIKQDQMDTFLVGDLDFYQLAAGDPTGLFFKLRYGCRLAENKNYDKAMQVVEKAQGLAQEALVDLEREWAAKLAADEEERKQREEQERLERKSAPSPKNAAPASPKNAPASPKNAPASPRGKKGEAVPLIVDPNAELRDVILMCKTKVRIWHHLHHK